MKGSSYSSFFSVKRLRTSQPSRFTVLKWAGYPVSADTFEFYESEEHFRCYQEETNPALSAHVRLLAALRVCKTIPGIRTGSTRSSTPLHRFDENGSYWWDKWHSSPYYVSGASLGALRDIDDHARSLAAQMDRENAK